MGPRAFIRRHPPPAPRAAAELEALVRAQGFPDFDMASSGALQAALLRLGEQGVSPDTIRAIVALCTHPMRPAEYLAAGSMDSSVHWRHYALNIPYYTHFTSPIRRYADVLVHRLLMDSLVAEQAQQQAQAQAQEQAQAQAQEHPTSPPCCSLDVEALQAQARHCNEKKLAAKNAQEASDRLYLCVYVAARGPAGLEAEGVIVGLGAKSFTVLVPSLDMEHRLYLGDIPGLAAPTDVDVDALAGSESGVGAGVGAGKTLTLRAKGEEGQSPPWGTQPWTLRLFDRVRVRATSKADAVPLMVKLDLLGPATA